VYYTHYISTTTYLNTEDIYTTNWPLPDGHYKPFYHVSIAQRLPVFHSDATAVTAAILAQPDEVLVKNPFDLINFSAWWGGGRTRRGENH
jgi:hypothetical protein